MQLEDYIKELNKLEVLQPAEEKALWHRFKAEGDEQARRRLIQSYQPLVFKTALPYRHLEGVMDVIQEGTVGLIEAVESFDWERGVAFSLYAVHRIRGRMLNYLQREQGIALACLTENPAEGQSRLELIPDTEAPVAEQAEQHYLADKVQETLQRLPEKERLVLEGLYLESNEAGELAESLQVSTSHVYRLQKTGIRRVRGMLSRFMQHWKD